MIAVAACRHLQRLPILCRTIVANVFVYTDLLTCTLWQSFVGIRWSFKDVWTRAIGAEPLERYSVQAQQRSDTSVMRGYGKLFLPLLPVFSPFSPNLLAPSHSPSLSLAF